jgi:hypothetical protein
MILASISWRNILKTDERTCPTCVMQFGFVVIPIAVVGRGGNNR